MNPLAGLDPGERNRFYNLLADVGEQVIVILSTHIVQDVTDLCTKMAIIHKGQVLLVNTASNLVQFAGRPKVIYSDFFGDAPYRQA